MFAIAALVGLLQVPLNNWAEGECKGDNPPEGCKANWPIIHVIQIITLGLTSLLSLWDIRVFFLFSVSETMSVAAIICCRRRRLQP